MSRYYALPYHGQVGIFWSTLSNNNNCSIFAGLSRKGLLEWCLDNSFELIDLEPAVGEFDEAGEFKVVFLHSFSSPHLLFRDLSFLFFQTFTFPKFAAFAKPHTPSTMCFCNCHSLFPYSHLVCPIFWSTDELAEKTGVARVIQALQCAEWPNIELKGFRGQFATRCSAAKSVHAILSYIMVPFWSNFTAIYSVTITFQSNLVSFPYKASHYKKAFFERHVVSSGTLPLLLAPSTDIGPHSSTHFFLESRDQKLPRVMEEGSKCSKENNETTDAVTCGSPTATAHNPADSTQDSGQAAAAALAGCSSSFVVIHWEKARGSCARESPWKSGKTAAVGPEKKRRESCARARKQKSGKAVAAGLEEKSGKAAFIRRWCGICPARSQHVNLRTCNAACQRVKNHNTFRGRITTVHR